VLLTIGMMVKNEEKHLEDCLEALNLIREELDTELIIVDTGSDDNTVEIAKEFTDKVYFHKWNDNFSEMRNTVISYAKGDWYFSLDGDEVVSNPKTIIDFFKNGNHKRYNTALVTQKNYTDVENDKFALDMVPRIFKNDEDFHFEGAIHNQPQYKKPIKELDTILNHYGYISSDSELMEKKFNRTATILKQELEKNPENIYYWYQLSRSYAMHGEPKEALEAIINAYKILKKKTNNHKKYIMVYIQLSKMYLKNKRFGKSEEIAQKAINIKDGYIDIYYYLAKSQYYLNKRKESLQNFKEYINLVNDYDNAKSRKDISVSNETISSSDYAYKYIIYLCAELEQDYKYALDSSLIIENKAQLFKIVKPFIDICLESENYNYLKDFFMDKSKKILELRAKFIKDLENKRINLDQSVENEIINTFADLEDYDEYILLNKVRNNIINNSNTIQIEKIKNINLNDKPNFYGDIIYYILMKRTDEVFHFLSPIKENNLNKFISYINKKYDDLDCWLLKFIDDIPEDISKLRINKIFGRYLIAFDNDVALNSNYIIDKYLKAGITYLEKLYKPEIIENELVNELKNEEEVFLLYMSKGLGLKEKNTKEYIKYLRKALDSYPSMKVIVEKLLSEIKNEQMDNENNLDEYKKKLKNNLEKLINSNKLEEAKNIIKEYETNFNKDVEIYSMESIVLIMEKNFNQAEEILKIAIEKYNDVFDLQYNLAFVYENKDEYKKAYEIYNEIIDVAQDEDLINELKEKINKLESEVDISKKENKNIGETVKNIVFKPGEINTKTLKLYKSNKHQEIINKIQELNKNQEYKKILNICDYWLKKVDNKTAAIHYYAGVAFNGISYYEKAIEHHTKALKNDKSLADIKNSSSKYQGEYNESKTNCLGCNSDDYTIVNVNNQSRVKDNKELINPLRIWVKCNNCGLIYANPIPGKESLNKYYSLLADEDDINVENRFEFLVRMSNKRLEKIERYHNKGTLLDIGTGSGFFVGAAIDRGWEATGLELAEGNCKYAKENFNIDLINKDFYDFEPGKKYDVVTLFEVIEHLRDPVKAINKAKDLLKEDGVFVLATPIRDSLYGKKAEEKNIFWTTVEHLIYFDKNVIINYLKENGFEVSESNLSEEGMGRMEFYCKKRK
jgi:glycosyltransferase involved in cell wall biosynthesis/SAM-dependent methyltransferase